MPTYEYRCPEGHDFEDFVLKISDAKPELPCPTCGAMAARRVSAGSGLLFKGSGFYITDYGKDGKKDQRAAAKSDTAAKSGDKSAATGATASSSSSTGSSSASGSSGSSSSPSTGSSGTKSGPAK